MTRGLTLALLGIALGAIVALGWTRFISDLLYTVKPYDPVAFGSAFAVMALASVAACLIPAWAATRIDPVRALKDLRPDCHPEER
jgi:putative ABC transport system permease protein